MKRSNPIVAVNLCLSIIAASSGASAAEAATARRAGNGACEATVAPAGSRVQHSHAVDLMTFPAQIGPDYTGCQKTWLGDSYLLLSLDYRGGQLSKAVLSEPDKEEVTCRYQRGTLKSGPRETCTELFRATEFLRKEAHPSASDPGER